MPLLHFVNCTLLAFLPLFVLDQCYQLFAWSSFWPVGGAYLVTQFVKMMGSAFFGVSHTWVQGVLALVLSPDVNPSLLDLLALWWLLNYSRSLRKEFESPPFLVLGFGWSLADTVGSRLLPLWLNARNTEFTWDWLLFSFDANLQLVKILAACLLLSRFATKRSVLAPRMKQAYSALLFIISAMPVVESALKSLGQPTWVQTVTSTVAIVTLGTLSRAVCT